MRIFLAAASLAAGLGCAPAQAQFSAPGSVPPSGEAAEPAAPQFLQPRPRPARRAAPSAGAESAIADRTLLHNGERSRLELERREGHLVAVTLQLQGVSTEDGGRSCRVDLTRNGPVQLRDLGRETGLHRYELAVQSCAMSFSALAGAVLMSGPGQACVFREQACRVDVAGLWGPPAAVVMKNARDIEKARSTADQNVRNHYKSLIARASGANAVKTVAREQAGFSAEREMVCRAYDNEVQHGFCHARFSEARAAELAVRLGGAPKAVGEAPRERRKVRKQQPSTAGETTTPPLF